MFRNLEAEQHRRGLTNAEVAQILNVSRATFAKKQARSRTTRSARPTRLSRTASRRRPRRGGAISRAWDSTRLTRAQTSRTASTRTLTRAIARAFTRRMRRMPCANGWPSATSGSARMPLSGALPRTTASATRGGTSRAALVGRPGTGVNLRHKAAKRGPGPLMSL